MIDLFLLAFKNVRRNYRRTVITTGSVAVGFVALACFGGFVEFSFQGLRENTIRTQLGHLQITREGYAEDHIAESDKYLPDDWAEAEAALEAIDGITVVTQRVTFSGLATVGKRTVNIRVTGIAPEREEEFIDFETLIAGRQLISGDTSAGLIGQELQRVLRADIGDWVTVVTPTAAGLLNTANFQIVGIFQTGSSMYDSVYVKLPIVLAQSLRETDQDARLIVLLDDTEQLDEIAVEIRAALAGLGHRFEIRSWRELAVFYNNVVTLYTGLFTVFSLIIGIVVVMSVMNTMVMAVFERTAEIGALRAMGARRGLIVGLFIAEGLTVGILGTMLGAVSALLAAEAVVALGGIPIPPPPGLTRGYQANFLITSEVLARASMVTLAASLLSCVLPAFSASRVNIVAALRHA